MLTDEFKAMSLKDQAVIIKALRQLHKEARVEAKILKSAERAARASARQEKREQAIVVLRLACSGCLRSRLSL